MMMCLTLARMTTMIIWRCDAGGGDETLCFWAGRLIFHDFVSSEYSSNST